MKLASTSRLSAALRKIVTLSEHSGKSIATAFSRFSSAALRSELIPNTLFFTKTLLPLVGLIGSWFEFISMHVRRCCVGSLPTVENAIEYILSLGIIRRRHKLLNKVATRNIISDR